MGEADFIAKLIEGDEKTFREFVEKYRQMVLNTCFGLLHNIEDAEDVSQEVFIEVFRSVKNFRSGSKISTWLYRIAVNRSLNFIRNNKKYRWFRSFDEEARLKMDILKQTASTDEGNPEYNLENRQRSVLLYEAIDSLPKNQRVAFTLSKYEGLGQKEIAEVMNLSVSSVESLIHRAKKNLQKKLYICYKKKYF
jgi:RNA polymerase sigma-70 factor, ECF subfamily